MKYKSHCTVHSAQLVRLRTPCNYSGLLPKSSALLSSTAFPTTVYPCGQHGWIPAAGTQLTQTQVIKDFLTPLCMYKPLSPMHKARPPVCMT